MKIKGGCIVFFCPCCLETHVPLRWETNKDTIFGAQKSTLISTPLKVFKCHTLEAATSFVWFLKWRDTAIEEKWKEGMEEDSEGGRKGKKTPLGRTTYFYQCDIRCLFNSY